MRSSMIDMHPKNILQRILDFKRRRISQQLCQSPWAAMGEVWVNIMKYDIQTQKVSCSTSWRHRASSK